MSKVRLAYGHTGLEISCPPAAEVILPTYTPGVQNEVEQIRSALRDPYFAKPLREQARPGDRVVIAHSDRTRATPNARLLPPILQELEIAGVSQNHITILNALGTHRQHSEHETRALLGDWIVDHYCCLQHDAYDNENLVSIGKTKWGHPVRLNRRLLEADLKILTGFIEPHLFAGFSGGPKCILPGLAGAESVITNHSVAMIGHPQATWGITYGNPLWEEMLDVALRVQPLFLVNVTLNIHRQITGIFAGDLAEAHKAGCDFVRSLSMVKTYAPFDLVITTNSGYPLDQNLYQCAKGMRAAEPVTRRGGAVLLVAACQDGIPHGSHYERLLKQAGSLDGIDKMLANPSFKAQDQWMLQIQAAMQKKVNIYIFSDGLTENQIREALFFPVIDLENSINQLIQQYGTRVCILPEGPQVIAHL